jgi:hypothetical protein
MSVDSKQIWLVEVPFHCPLPAFCPICGSPADKTLRARAWEGIPLVFTYHVSVGIPYCRSHYTQLVALEFRQRLAVWGIFLFPLASLLPAIAEWSLVWLFYVGCLFSVVCLFFAFQYFRKLRVCRGIQMRTLGSWPGYSLRSFRPEWNEALTRLVEQFKKTHETRH